MIKCLKFSAVWCGPCRSLKPIYESVKEEMTDVEFEEIDIDQYPALAAQYKIMAVPTLVFLLDGQEADRAVGFIKKEEIIDRINGLK